MRRTVAILGAVLVASSFLLVRLGGPEAQRRPALAPKLAASIAPVASAPAPVVPTRPLRARGRASSEPSGAPAAAGATLASVVCGLTSPGGERPGGGVVLLRHGARLVERGELRDGQARFTGLVPGRYSLEVEIVSLPPGWLAAPCARTCTSRTPFTLVRGERRELALDVVRAATVQGFVHGPAGGPVSGAMIRLQSTRPGLQSVQATAQSDARGYYELVDVLPGTYRAQVRWPAEACVAAPPAPALHVFDANGSYAVDFRGESASHGLQGRLVDAEGRPAAGVTVVCELIEQDLHSAGRGQRAAEWSRVLARTTTDDEGAFQLRRLPSARVAVRVAPRLGSTIGLRTHLPALQEMLAGPFDLSTASDPVDLGALVVRPPASVARGPASVSAPARSSPGS